jgi:hypothetical protein
MSTSYDASDKKNNKKMYKPQKTYVFSRPYALRVQTQVGYLFTDYHR